MRHSIDQLLTRVAAGRMSRREFLEKAAAVGISSSAAISLLSRTGHAQTAGQTHINFMVWSYGIETIQDNIKRFQQMNPNITVSLQDVSWFNYHDTMATKFTSGDAPDVAYSSDHWLREWVAADWIARLDQYAPQLASAQGEWAPYSRQGMTLGGHLYGLPYYSDLIIFMYNAKMLQQAGFSHPPATWEELASQAKTIKDKGISQYPIDIPMKKDDPWTIEIFYSMVYSRGGHMFDKNDNPVFNTPGGQAEQALTWLGARCRVRCSIRRSSSRRNRTWSRRWGPASTFTPSWPSTTWPSSMAVNTNRRETSVWRSCRARAIRRSASCASTR